MIGEEKLALHFIFPWEYEPAKFSQIHLNELAGDGFNNASIMLLWIGMLVHLPYAFCP